ncbi:hypothetical protein RJ55_07478 [Drechmeria coniospora]|nr:hypothetical protein RJ55_07478 [Drechmeria coniospora]
MADLGPPCSTAVEDVFGPTVASSCLGGFDFTLLFEESILTLPALGIALAWSLLRFRDLFREPAKVRASWLLPLKLALYVIYVILQVVLLALWIARGVTSTRLTVACVALTIAGFVVLAGLSSLEHARSVRPSTLLTLYLGISLLLDMARTRTLFHIAGGETVSGIFLTAFIIKLFLFAAEVTEKRSMLREKWQNASPEDTGGIANRSLFLWLNYIFVKGYRTLLTVDVLTPLDAEILEASDATVLSERWEKTEKTSDHTLILTYLKHYKWPILAGVLPRLAYTGFSFSQPFLIERVLDFTAEEPNENKTKIACSLVGAYAISYIGLSLAYAVYQHKTYRLLTLYRGSLITMIFEKTLRIDSEAEENAEAITLMSADIDRIGSCMSMIHELYCGFLEAGIALWLLYRYLGVAVVAPIIWIIICLFLGMPIAKAAGNAQTPWLEAIEVRLSATAKALGSMKAIKMTGLADIVSTKIADLRLSEIRASLRHRVLDIGVFVTYFSSSALAPVFGFATYSILARANDSEPLTEGTAFAALSVFELLNQPMMFAIDGYEHLQTVINSFRRIQEYLLSKERDDYRIIGSSSSTSSSIMLEKDLDEKSPAVTAVASSVDASEFVVSVKDGSTGYEEEGTPILKDLNLQIPHDQMTVIFGPVGSGKSTLLKYILGEMPHVSGSISTSFTKAAYTPQRPWSTWGTVQSNIVGMSPWDKKWYDTVIAACALLADLDELPDGDQTHTGTQGSRLSGGQQMRVSLARALYSRNSVMVFDDVLSGLDRATERHILDAVFGPGGLIQQINATVIMATNSANHLNFADHLVFLNADGEVVKQGPRAVVAMDDEDIEKLASQPQTRTVREEPELSEEVQEALQEIELLENPVEEPGIVRNAGDMRIYAYYAKNAGWGLISLYLAACATFVFGVTFPSIWLQWWTNSNAQHPNERLGYWLGVFAALAGLTILGCALADCVFKLIVLPRTSKRFHELLLNTTMRASTSFLTSTNAGTTVNRFSQDLELIDNDLPQAIDQTIFQFMSAIVALVFVFMGSGYVSAAIPLCILCLVVVQFYYLRTSRQLRLLDIEAKAPLFSQFLETVNGVACIRAYGWSHSYLERNTRALNISQKPYYLMWCIQRWLTLVLDLFNAGVAILLVGIATNIQSGNTAFLGVALYNLVTFSSGLQTLVTEWTQVETALGAISRIRSFVMNVKDENLPHEDGEVDESWPEKGAIAISGISASYDSSEEPVLKEISFDIKAGEKVAICGRTGSGKSSLVSTLLRMLDVDSGKICIDGVDISTIPRQVVRARLNTLPQEPFFLHGSVRENLDFAETASDERIEEVLRTVGLWEIIESRGGLDEDLDDTLSQGQRQLFCLARAMIKPGNILIMDEATSSVDSETDELMQRVVRDEFKGRTLLAIAHKLQTVLDFDRIVLLDKGRIVEMGNPQELLKQEGSAFRTLYESLDHEGDREDESE